MGDVLKFNEWSGEVRHRKARRAARVELSEQDIIRHQAVGPFAPTPARQRHVPIEIRNVEHRAAASVYEEPHTVVDEPMFMSMVAWICEELFDMLVAAVKRICKR